MTMPEQNDGERPEQGRDGRRSLITQDRPAESAIDSLFYEQGKLRADLDRARGGGVRWSCSALQALIRRHGSIDSLRSLEIVSLREGSGSKKCKGRNTDQC